VTKHADVEVSGQTVKTCLIKHRSNYGHKPLRAHGTHARAKHVWYGCPNEQNIPHQTREQKKCFKLFDRMFDSLQIFSNTTKHDQTRSNSTKQGGQTVKCLVTQQCLMVFGRQTFPVWTGLNTSSITRVLINRGSRYLWCCKQSKTFKHLLHLITKSKSSVFSQGHQNFYAWLWRKWIRHLAQQRDVSLCWDLFPQLQSSISKLEQTC